MLMQQKHRSLILVPRLELEVCLAARKLCSRTWIHFLDRVEKSLRAEVLTLGKRIILEGRSMTPYSLLFLCLTFYCAKCYRRELV